MTEESRPLAIDIVSDVVCPWCYIGKRRLEAALADRGERAAPLLRWHAFQLNPDIPSGGVDRRSYLESKFGGPRGAAEAYARVEAAGREVGIPFAFDRIRRQPNTLDAHRLLAWAQAQGPQAASELAERLFSAYFVEGIDIGDLGELAHLAGMSGLEEAAAHAWLATDGGRADVAAADRRAHELGIGGVPFFIFNQRLGVSGAQPPEVLRDAMEQAEVSPIA
jgi:predicted DsbA family dithiol-disulfide isomerase